jgi:hypothetical protein
MPEPIVYLAHERPDVEVLWEGAWCPGELRMQRQDGAGQWLLSGAVPAPGRAEQPPRHVPGLGGAG